MHRPLGSDDSWIPDSKAVAFLASEMAARAAWPLAARFPVTRVTDFGSDRLHNSQQRRRDAADR
jgi:hypothetical protein